ncbi:RluA family pseudouridine synthase [Companilactobacillus sp.]|jgi:23S rRNA pseudouridine1911/1915/1917 synthase|uniref:RluA family pseudouridine synthase n=1 Tax=Companilactobacillus sp. TaxID=2767905 RepID=UPI0025BD31B2|nr:RluA family pseudouridine synthase [Companilactobacillus sp.]MCH4008831.1 RluA family pseudouridine synthase [Companilactobacillus sp.]MCH4050990.1 RluA family pseudouridine synthase [Companilactobacillus sp.]MCH4076774.1 RluA family pseudouridine synthase [Companilactobacillus sp.]MCH4125349.1 RluA family pseudouridine synthase [Companilactobacillus sp.]MCH4131890.1 RluA family pseudouridine synthase [Companilactobacillus sp.]
MTSRRYLKYRVTETDKKVIRKFLVHKKFSSSQLHNLKNKGGLIFVNHRQRHFNYQMKTGDEILIVMSVETPSDLIKPMPGQVDVIYEDKYFLVINKPPGIASLPAKALTSKTMANIVKYYLEQNGENGTIHLVTRLDRDTSGLMVFAKNSYAHSMLDQILHSDHFQKYYLAIIYGHMEPESGLIDLPIGIDQSAFYLRTIDHDNGKPSKTIYKTVERFSRGSLLKLKLLTGRTHQIRVHLKASGHPIFGDYMYTNQEEPLINRQALHCAELKIVHPVTGELLDLQAPLPEDMTRLCQTLRG